MPDSIFADPRLARLYDFIDDDRSDLDVYERLVDELAATSVLDVGCGTGTFACRLARRGIDVYGLDPAAASLAIARGKPGAELVHWIEADATDAPRLNVDLAVMTGNVAQVFVTDAEWSCVLDALHEAIGDEGWLVFETRDPARRAWKSWTKARTRRELHVPEVGLLETWTELIDVFGSLVSFRQVFRFAHDGSELVSESTLRFRARDEIANSLNRAGFAVQEVRDAPDRPAAELVFLARPTPAAWLPARDRTGNRARMTDR